MSEEIQTHQDSEHTDAAAASRRLFSSENRGRLELASAGLIGALVIGGVVGSNIENGAREDARNTTISQEYKQSQKFPADMYEISHDTVDPANVVGVFSIEEGSTIYGRGLAIAEAQPAFIQASDSTKNHMIATLAGSGDAIGSYDPGDEFTVSYMSVGEESRKTFVIQDAKNIQEPTIPSPITH